MSTPPAQHTQTGELLELLLEQLADRIAARIQTSLGAPAQTPDGSPWLDIHAAAAYLRWPRQRLYKLTAQGAIPHYKHEGRLVFHRAELDAWLREHAQPYRPANL
jgi:excisionase family DNA binding protein